MSITQCVLVTNNKKKCNELEAFLSDLHLPVIRYSELLGKSLEIEESATSFEGNAIIKAEALLPYSEQIKHSLIIADDSGIEVDALNKEPGVYSARYGGPGLTDEQRCHHLLHNLKDHTNRRARFRCVIAAIFPSEGLKTFDGSVEGHISQQIKGEKGFGYDPLFIPEGYTQSFAELDPSIKASISHRAKALAQLKQALKKSLQQH